MRGEKGRDGRWGEGEGKGWEEKGKVRLRKGGMVGWDVGWNGRVGWDLVGAHLYTMSCFCANGTRKLRYTSPLNEYKSLKIFLSIFIAYTQKHDMRIHHVHVNVYMLFIGAAQNTSQGI